VKRIPALVALLLFAFIAAAQDSQQSSLADAAKEKSAKKAAHVFTNDEIPERPDLSPTDAPPPKPAAAPSAEKQANAPVPDTPEVKAAREKLQEAQTKEANVAAQVKAAESAQASATGPDRDTADTMLQDKKANLVEAQTERSAAEKALADAIAKAGGTPAGGTAAAPTTQAAVPIEDRPEVKDARAKVADLQKQQAQAEDDLKTAEQADSSTATAGRVRVDSGVAQKRAALEQIRSNLAGAQTELNDVLAKAQASAPKPPDASDQAKPQQ